MDPDQEEHRPSPYFQKFYDQVLDIQQDDKENYKNILTCVLEVIGELKLRKQEALKHFDGALLSAAKEVLEELLQEAENLKSDLENDLEILSKDEEYRKAHIEKWIQLYAVWCDKKGLVKKVVERAAQHNQAMIDKDVKVITDYGGQSLAHLSIAPSELPDIEGRLKAAIESPLKNLLDLKIQPAELSLDQAVEWVAHLSQKRESYFDIMLMKIDMIVKEIVGTTEHEQMHEQELGHEVEGELKSEIFFMEKELAHIKELMTHSGEEVQNPHEILERLRSLYDHLEQWQGADLPLKALKRLEKLTQNIITTIQELES